MPVSTSCERRALYEQSQTRLSLSLLSHGRAETAARPHVWLLPICLQLGACIAPADVSADWAGFGLSGPGRTDDRAPTPGTNRLSFRCGLCTAATERAAPHAGLHQLLRGARRFPHLQEAARAAIGHLYPLRVFLQRRQPRACQDGGTACYPLVASTSRWYRPLQRDGLQRSNRPLCASRSSSRKT